MFFKRFTDIGFQQNHDTAKTLQNKPKMQNFNTFALSEIQKLRISIGNSSYFRILTSVAKLIWWTRIVFVKSPLRTTSLRPSLQTVCFRSTLRTLCLRQVQAAAAEWAKPREIRRGTPEAQHSGSHQACETTKSYSFSETPVGDMRARRVCRASSPPIFRIS